jgi:hypothetical protein
LQEGNFSADPSIDWGLRALASQRNASLFFAGLSRLVDSDPAFAFRNAHPNIENHIDSDNKVISLDRIDFATGRHTYALINLGHRDFDRGYVFGGADGRYRIAFASDLQTGEVVAASPGIHEKPRQLSISRLPPYGVVVLQQR